MKLFLKILSGKANNKRSDCTDVHENMAFVGLVFHEMLFVLDAGNNSLLDTVSVLNASCLHRSFKQQKKKIVL